MRSADPTRQPCLGVAAGGQRRETGQRQRQERQSPRLPRCPCAKNRRFKTPQMVGPFVQAAPQVEQRAAPGQRAAPRQRRHFRCHIRQQPGIRPSVPAQRGRQSLAQAPHHGHHQPPRGPGRADQPLAAFLRRADPIGQPQRQLVRRNPVTMPPAQRTRLGQCQPLKRPRPGDRQPLGQPPQIKCKIDQLCRQTRLGRTPPRRIQKRAPLGHRHGIKTVLL